MTDVADLTEDEKILLAVTAPNLAGLLSGARIRPDAIDETRRRAREEVAGLLRAGGPARPDSEKHRCGACREEGLVG